MIVKVKPIKREQKWSGFKGAMYKGAKHILTAVWDKHGILNTGLTKEDEERLGAELKVDLDRRSSYWHDFKIVMTDKDLVLNTENPEDELKLKVLLIHPKIQKTLSEKNAYAEYVIYNESEEAKVINTGATIKTKAYVLFGKLTDSQKADILRLYGELKKTSTVTPEVINATLFKKLEEDASKFVRLVEDKNRDMKILLKDLVNSNILRKNKSAYKYGNDFLGHDEESTIDFLNDPENQSLKITLMQELKEKNK